jgi:hypothetical protein
MSDTFERYSNAHAQPVKGTGTLNLMCRFNSGTLYSITFLRKLVFHSEAAASVPTRMHAHTKHAWQLASEVKCYVFVCHPFVRSFVRFVCRKTPWNYVTLPPSVSREWHCVRRLVICFFSLVMFDLSVSTAYRSLTKEWPNTTLFIVR